MSDDLERKALYEVIDLLVVKYGWNSRGSGTYFGDDPPHVIQAAALIREHATGPLRECLQEGIKLQDTLASFAERQAWAERASRLLGDKT